MTKTIKNETLTVTFKLPGALNKKINEKIIEDGYSLRGKSKWIKEAIINLLELPDFIELVSMSNELHKAQSSVSARIPKNLMLKIEKAVLDIRKEYPVLEGLKSRIIRTAIFQRLLRW